ncbi:DASS family sodium-coupled anion symporter [Campylobacter hyointestinalis]|uniref:DASS family sodium-coupled anion symporter n=1 Tax=Campylobacter hyointestinalis TaxID=198 RepID=UPI0007249BDE|nr:DASS family sodium-coupled anion symporter [Campylobacter hyointestinalis]PPB55381.1 carboxylate transporter [Campylobacter hyointestinalis subsp. hyointestinalis]PPB58419.1 carboxylate transporter [Campylobacter hyointestinalis subsp. hyointestinalis]PPB62391.1 carboxylate transporter [Campylobacter hyointestinalis subsp. hyointestinalis]PPB63314.1 carboxylate transporter [Campylobacter hyointestinalis subsp. hyointestinalis]PPB68206.1 carboxylate transporter [Campylobacter hyointestinalis
MEKPIDKKTNWMQIIGLFGGIIAAILVYIFFPSDAPEIVNSMDAAKEAIAKGKPLNTDSMAIAAAVAILMGIWWMSEAATLAVTALLPLVLFPILGADTFKNVAAPYANDTIFLFMGGFILALAMQKWNLHTRIAIGIVLMVGTSPRRLIAGFMVATGFITMWVNNTATTIMMLPVGLSVLHLVEKLRNAPISGTVEGDMKHLDTISKQSTQGGVVSTIAHKAEDVIEKVKERTAAFSTNFGISLMLGIAYAATIGSTGTIVGSTSTAFFVGHMQEVYGIEIGFGEWMLMGLPLSILMMGFCWFLLTFVIFPPEMKEIPGGKDVIHEEYRKLGKITTAEILVAIIFASGAFCWIFLGFILRYFDIRVTSLNSLIAISMAVLFFLIPANRSGERLIDWTTAKTLPWDMLILFGGGLALSAQLSKTGLSLWIGHLVQNLSGMNIILIIVVVTALVIFLTEIVSNTATAATFIPIIAGVALGLGYEGRDIMVVTIPVTLAAIYAFMLPVGTPPNAIAYGSGFVRMKDMIKAGFWLNIAGIVIITLITCTMGMWAFGLKFH